MTTKVRATGTGVWGEARLAKEFGAASQVDDQVDRLKQHRVRGVVLVDILGNIGTRDDALEHLGNAHLERVLLGRWEELQHAQQFDLERERYVADFIEEKRAAIGAFNLTLGGLYSSGERAFFVAEEFALQQILRNCRTVDSDKWFPTAIAGIV